MKRLPLIPTLIVLAAVGVMIALGIWQVGRAGEKEAMLARFEAAAGLPPLSELPPASNAESAYYRRVTARCERPGAARVFAGRSRSGQTGFSHVVDCATFRADIGWSDRPTTVRWSGGQLSGVVAPDRERTYRLIADQGQAGLQSSAPPDPADIPNNHRSYAFQWFAFALAALIIYGLALRGRRREKP